MLFTACKLEKVAKNGKQLKKGTFCVFDVSVPWWEKNSCPRVNTMKHLCSVNNPEENTPGSASMVEFGSLTLRTGDRSS